uniref:IRS-type PTB domain-containing protein n=2 Tax=Schistocephalus solidus TaxID=70667 RepID=A0A0X3PB15_SCHSO
MNPDVTTLIHSYANVKGLRRRYVSLVSTADLTEAYLLFFVNETKWRTSIPSSSSSEATHSLSFLSAAAVSNGTTAAATATTLTGGPALDNVSYTNGIHTCPSVLSVSVSSRPSLSPSLSMDNPLLTNQLAAVENVRKGFKYISLDGLFFVGATQAGPKPSVTSALKNALGRILQLKKPPESSLDPDTQLTKPDSSCSAPVSAVPWPVSTDSAAPQRPQSAYFGSTRTELNEGVDGESPRLASSSARPASIHGLPSGTLNSTSFFGASKSSIGDFVEATPSSLGLYFEDGSYTVMSFSSRDVFDKWLQVLSAIVAVNRVRRSFPHIEYASTVTCKFKAKESNAGPFPKIRGECLFCLSKLDVILLSKSVKNPDLSIRFPYVRRCASRDDGRLCLDIGRAAPTGECQLVLQMYSAKEAKFAHTRCIALMSHCSTWLKLGRDGPSSRRRTIPNLGHKSSSIKLAGPPLPRFPTSITESTVAVATPTSHNVLPQPLLPKSLLLPSTPFCPASLSVLTGAPAATVVTTADALPPSICYKSCSFPTIPEVDPPVCSASSMVERSHSEPFSEEQTQLEQSATPGFLKSSVFSSPACEGEDSAPSTSHPPSPGIHSEGSKETGLIAGLVSNSKPEMKGAASSISPDDSADHYLHLSLGTQGLMGPHIKRITKYPLGRTGTADEETDVPSEETIRRVLAFLAGVARQSNTGESPDPLLGESQQQVTHGSSTPSVTSAVSFCTPTIGDGAENTGLASRPPLLSPVFTNPSSLDAKRFEQTRYLPASINPLVRDFAHYNREGIYLDPVLEGYHPRNALANGNSVQAEATYAPVGANAVPFVADKNSFCSLLLKSDGTSTTTTTNISSACTPASLMKPVQLRHQRSKRNHRTRIYSHRDNDEIFADLTYEANAGDARNRGSGAASTTTTVGLSVSGRSSTSFESKSPSLLLDLQQRSALQILQQQLVAVNVSASEGQRPRTASDTSNWKRQPTQQSLSTCQSGVAAAIAAAGCSWDLRPRARSLTHYLGGGKPLSQPIHVKDLSTRLLREGSYLVKSPAPAPVAISDTNSSRSNSSTSASKHIIRAIEHVLGRSRSTTTTATTAATTTTTTTEEAGAPLSANNQTGTEGATTAGSTAISALGVATLLGEKRQPQLSDIYAEMDFSSPRTTAFFQTAVPSLQPPPLLMSVRAEHVEPSTPIIKPLISTLRDSALLVTPSGSLSSTSSLSYDTGCGGNLLYPGTTNHMATNYPQTATTVNFNDPYGLFNPRSDNRFADRPLSSFFTATVTKKSLATPRNFT